MMLLALYLSYRIAIINLTHEAKGLDTYEKTREKFVNCKDKRSITILDHNYREEIGHVALGLKWFKYIAKNRKFSTSCQSSYCIDYFHQLSRRYFKGKLKEPFNHIARYQAGLTNEWYIPLAK